MDAYKKEIKIQLVQSQLALYARRRQFAKSRAATELERYLASSESGLLIGYTFYFSHLMEKSLTQSDIIKQTGLTRQHVFNILRDLTDMNAVLVKMEKRRKTYYPTGEFIDVATSACNKFIDSLDPIFGRS